MPTYAYRCDKCGRSFSLLQTIREREAVRVVCPQCRSNRVTTRKSAPTALSARKN